MLKTIIESKLNIPPESEVNEKLSKLTDGWEVVQASTVAVLSQEVWKVGDEPFCGGEPKHVVYVTTIVLEFKK
jgi:hypothetical protein